MRRLAVHGLTVALEGGFEAALDEVFRDFAWFASASDAGAPDVVVRLERGAPDWDAFGPLEAAFVTPRNVVYEDGARTVIDWFGRASGVLSRADGTLVVRGEDVHLVHEAAYLFLLSRIGEHLDALGLPRLHALALSGRGGGAVAVMLPSGGGKSTLAVRALRADGVRLLAEDTPLLDSAGCLHPFPLRIGVNPADAESLPPGHVRRVERMEFHPKLLVDLDGFRDRVEPAPQPLRHLVVGARSLAREPRLERVPRRAAAGALFRECVVGLGVYQGMEFVLQRGMRDVAGKAGTAAMRARCCAAALRRAQVWRLVLGRDHDANWRALEPLLAQHRPG
ncbi:MAG TPA: hypothetical protein VF529_02075 [Solirubrobacteraceae bacterium]|jgi:hypothetical protein